jgi:hypothetical protein
MTVCSESARLRIDFPGKYFTTSCDIGLLRLVVSIPQGRHPRRGSTGSLTDIQPNRRIVDLTAAIALNPQDIVAYRFRALAYDAKRDTTRADLDFAAEKKLEQMTYKH